MITIVTVIHVVTAVLLVLVVLLQSGKGAEISASLGGSSNTIFGSSGGANVFVHITQALAAIFMITSIGLTYLGNAGKKSVFDGAAPVAPASAPAGQVAPSGAPAAPADPAAKK